MRRGSVGLAAMAAVILLLAASGCASGATPDGPATAPTPNGTPGPLPSPTRASSSRTTAPTTGSRTTTAPTPNSTPRPLPAPTGASSSRTTAPTTASRTTMATRTTTTTTTTRPASTSTTRTTTTSPTATCSLPSAQLGRDVESLGTARTIVALTFDAGSSNAGVTKILAALRDTGTPASFFLTGAFARAYPSSARAIAVTYPVGNHSMTHPEFTSLTDAEIATQLAQARAGIMSVTGQDPRPWFRFPFGDRDARTIAAVNRQCYVPFRWTVDSLGWKGTSGGMTRDQVVARVMNGVQPGGIVLMHVGANPDDGTTLDADVLGSIISGLRARGYTFTTLDAVVSSALG